MILIVGAFALLVVAIAVALIRTQGAMRLSREGVDVGTLPGITPEPSPTP